MTNAYEQASVQTSQAHENIIVDLHLKICHRCSMCVRRGEGNHHSCVHEGQSLIRYLFSSRISLLLMFRSSEFATGGTM